MPRFLAVIASKHCRHRRHCERFTVSRPQCIAADSHPHARRRHQRLTAKRCNIKHNSPYCRREQRATCFCLRACFRVTCTPHTLCRYTTLYNINIRKLYLQMHS